MSSDAGFQHTGHGGNRERGTLLDARIGKEYTGMLLFAVGCDKNLNREPICE